MFYIDYTTSFDTFLDTLSPVELDLVNNEIVDLVDNIKKSKPKECKHYKNHNKIQLDSVDAIVYYELTDDAWIFYDGFKMVKRVS